MTAEKKKKASPKNKVQLKRQEKRQRQKYLRIGTEVIGLALVAGYFLWLRPQALAVSPDRFSTTTSIHLIENFLQPLKISKEQSFYWYTQFLK